MKKVYLGIQPTRIHRVPTEEGQSIEQQIRQATANKEPIDATAPMLYTEKAKGVLPEYDIRTDRWDKAIEATDKFTKSERAKSDNKPQEGDVKNEPIEEV